MRRAAWPEGRAAGGYPSATTHTLAANAVAQYRLAAAIMPDLHDIQYELGNALQEVSGGLRPRSVAVVVVAAAGGHWCWSCQMWHKSCQVLLHKSLADVGWLGSCGHVRAAAG